MEGLAWSSAVSVISKWIWRGFTPLWSRAWVRVASKEPAMSWRRETLIAMVSWESAACHLVAWAHASSRTQAPMLTINEELSATGRNSAGARSPRVGCCQRSSASTPLTRLEVRSMMGW